MRAPARPVPDTRPLCLPSWDRPRGVAVVQTPTMPSHPGEDWHHGGRPLAPFVMSQRDPRTDSQVFRIGRSTLTVNGLVMRDGPMDVLRQAVAELNARDLDAELEAAWRRAGAP